MSRGSLNPSPWNCGPVCTTPSVRRPGRGFSLAELVVGMFLIVLLMSAAYEMLIPGLRAWTVANKRSHVRQTSLLAINRIARDIEASCIESVTVQPDTHIDPETDHAEDAYTVSFLSAFDASGQIRERPDGSIIWQQYEVVHLDAVRHLLYLGYRPLLYDESDNLVMRLETFTPDPLDRPLARGVRGFSAETAVDELASVFSDPAAPARTNPVTLKVHVRDDTESCTLSTAANTGLAGDPVEAAAHP